MSFCPEHRHNHKNRLGDVEQILKDELGTETLETGNSRVSGTVNDGMSFDTDSGPIFVKFNAESEDGGLFEGEYAGLQAVWETNTLTVPEPIKYIKCPAGGAMLVLKYLDLEPISGENFATLGTQVARLHLHNLEQKNRSKRREKSINHNQEEAKYVDQFGFHITNHCGYFPQNNSWTDSWTEFFARKIEDHVTMVEEKFNNHEARPLFNAVVRVMPQLFRGLEVEPSLLHGDLWRGNIAQTDQGPVGYDPISLYGHSEFEISIAHCHRGFDQNYFDAYHNIIPKSPGFEDRLDLYLLHHYFQLWNHYGPQFNARTLKEVEPEVHGARFSQGYDVSTLNQMRKIVNKFAG